jgi:Na+-transporting NADH:ubiquinone oxidoreductase subunit B
VVMSLVLNMLAPSPSSLMALPVHYHLVMGSFAFGAVFMATDPVSAASTNPGKYVYGFLIGVLAIMVRVLNPAYPEGMMLSILFMNLFAPLIDFVVLRTNIRRRMRRAAG